MSASEKDNTQNKALSVFDDDSNVPARRRRRKNKAKRKKPLPETNQVTDINEDDESTTDESTETNETTKEAVKTEASKVDKDSEKVNEDTDTPQKSGILSVEPVFDDENDDDDDDEEEYEDEEVETKNDKPSKKSKSSKPVKDEKPSKKTGSAAAKAIGCFFAVLIIALAATVLAGHLYFQDRWYMNTVLNSVPVSRQQLSQTKTDLATTYDNYVLKINGRDDMSAEISKDDIDLKINAEQYIDDAFKNQHKTFYLFAFFTPQEINMTPEISYSEEKLADVIDNCELIAGSADKPINVPVDAFIKFSDINGYFVVQPETEGNTIVRKELDTAVQVALSTLLPQIDITDAEQYPDMFLKPQVRDTDEALNSEVDAYNSTSLHWITWKLTDSNSISVTPQDVMAWYTLDANNKPSLNEQAVQDWVEKFCLKYKSVGQTRTFTTHTGSTVEVSGGDYGWQLDYDQTVEQLMGVLKADSSAQIKAYIDNPTSENREALTTNLDVIYKNKGYKFNPANITDDYDTQNYSEISISEQMVYVYRGGECVYTAKCITGVPTPEKETTKGTWYIKERTRNETLRGEGYETVVSYWVRFTWSGIGYHDATWQSWGSWSPTSYITVGSHGCINLSMTDVANIFDLVESGDPVFVY
jgi:lipoprotein-anchoring transpeptidase ErfK/SrfK